MKKKKNGFTLAEVLITLSVLGVVAAVTVPSVVRNFQKRITITKLQKAYTTLERAAANMRTNSGCLNVACTGLLDYDMTDQQQLLAMQNKFIELTGLKAKDMGTPVSRAMYLYCEDPGQCIKDGKLDGTCGSLFSSHYYASADGIGYSEASVKIHSEKTSIASTDTTPNGILVAVLTDIKKAKKSTKNASLNAILQRGRNVFYFTIYDNFLVEPTVLSSQEL